jgi:hypothetical protein
MLNKPKGCICLLWLMNGTHQVGCPGNHTCSQHNRVDCNVWFCRTRREDNQIVATKVYQAK